MKAADEVEQVIVELGALSLEAAPLSASLAKSLEDLADRLEAIWAKLGDPPSGPGPPQDPVP
jgi:hypothetical protein